MKINPCKKEYSYIESHQSNPLRYTILHRDDEETFTAQTSEFKCKDYFNECVALYNGHTLSSIYGFVSADIKLNEEGVYVLLRNIASKTCYEANIGSINKLTAKDGFPAIQLTEHGEGYVLFIPKDYFKSTWTVSLLMYLVRVANVKEVVADPTWQKHPTLGIDNPFRTYYTKVLALGFKPPLNIASYYFAGKDWDYNTVPRAPEYVHNNGCYSWMSQVAAIGGI